MEKIKTSHNNMESNKSGPGDPPNFSPGTFGIEPRSATGQAKPKGNGHWLCNFNYAGFWNMGLFR